MVDCVLDIWLYMPSAIILYMQPAAIGICMRFLSAKVKRMM